MNVIELEDVSKSYRRLRRPPTEAVSELDLTVPEGGVHGFLGPNGSGKTTTIRMLLGLVRASAGSVRVLGAEVPAELATVVSAVGAIVEKPQLFGSFSALRNLQVLAPLGGVTDARIEECLALVGLADRAEDRVKTFSLGMLQRLAIAAALLKRPRLLILDEPTNGLDPAGMVEVRELIARLGSDGHTTVFLSSHLLGEVQQVCSSVTIINRGRLVRTGTIAELMATGAEAPAVRVVAADLAAAQAALATTGWEVALHEGALRVRGAPGPATVNERLGRAGVWALEIGPVVNDLEAAFLSLTQDASPEVAGVGGEMA